jgi:mRNA-degrading endonuclease RelE of RelBE toxin-antitoxin system
LKLRLNPRAERQLAALPAPAARKVVEALRVLEAVPNSGRRYPDDSEFRGLHYKLIVVRARRWSYRITYEIRPNQVVVFYLYPSWYPSTHPDLATESLPEDD